MGCHRCLALNGMRITALNGKLLPRQAHRVYVETEVDYDVGATQKESII